MKNYDTAAAVACLGGVFLDILKGGDIGLSGFDGEAWCKQAADYLPAAASVDGNLDPFHVNRAIGPCFAEPGADAERQVMQCIWFGRAGDAADLLEALADDGLARPKNAAQVAAYLRNNAELIRSCPPSLGTMESENEHLYASRELGMAR